MSDKYKSLNQRLLAEAIYKEWLPLGRLEKDNWCVGDASGKPGQSFKVHITDGIWTDFADGEKGGGDLISLYAKLNSMDQEDAYKALAGDFKEEAARIFPKAPPMNFPSHRFLKHLFASYIYYNQDGTINGIVLRCEFPDGTKQFPSLTCWEKNERIYWDYKGMGTNRPLFNLEKNNKSILIVEGEKKCLIAQKMLPEFNVVAWSGGAKAVKQTNWKSIKDRIAYVWPDNNEVGHQAAREVQKLSGAKIVTLPENTPEGWDLGDAPENFDAKPYIERCNIALVEKPSVPLLLTHYDPANTSKALGTMDNVRDLLLHYRIICRYNVVSKRIIHVVPGESFSTENEEEAAYACIFSYMKQNKIPVDGLPNYLTRIADENQYNPILNWIRSKTWDGFSRLQDLYDTIDSPENEAKELLIRRWLITAVHMAIGNGVDSAGCLVLQGPQGLGKTWWVKKLVPEDVRNDFVRTDATVDPKEKDSVSQIISYWICELGEIGATFRKADLDALKAFITRDHDTLRRPYGIGDKRYPRRTALVASVDQKNYLHDTAGNRRFWTIPCKRINSYHNIDMQQLWAEILHLIEKSGETWKLQDDEKEHISRINLDHDQIDPVYDMIYQRYDWVNRDYTRDKWKTATQISVDIGAKNVDQALTRKIAGIVRELNLNHEEFERRDGKGRYFLVPIIIGDEF